MMQGEPMEISIIIVNYNGKHFLKGCLESVLPQMDDRCELIIVDNASSDGSAEFIRTHYPQVRLIMSPVNEGFAGGNNRGVSAAAGRFVVLLNNDTVVLEGWLEGLRREMNDPKVAAASSLIRTEGIPDRYYEMNGSVNFLGHNIMRVFRAPSDIFYPGGASMIFRKDLLGLPFDDEYFVYGEDVYLGLRIRFMGWNVTHTNASRLEHFGSGTSKKHQNSFLTFYQERNRILNTLLFFDRSTLVKVFPYLLINAIGKLASAVLGGKFSLSGLLKAYGWLFGNIPLIRSKRAALRKERRVGDAAVIRSMTGKLTNGETLSGAAVNWFALLYCRIVRLPVIELTGQ